SKRRGLEVNRTPRKLSTASEESEQLAHGLLVPSYCFAHDDDVIERSGAVTSLPAAARRLRVWHDRDNALTFRNSINDGGIYETVAQQSQEIAGRQRPLRPRRIRHAGDVSVFESDPLPFIGRHA